MCLVEQWLTAFALVGSSEFEFLDCKTFKPVRFEGANEKLGPRNWFIASNV